MIITRTPFRISFAGGGSDLPAFYEQEPGAVLSTAINRHMYLMVKRSFGGTFRVSYSQTEIRESRDQIEHPIVRECLRKLDIECGLEIVSIADLPAESGMGSSSAFTVGLLSALQALQGRVTSAEQLAQQACEIEIERLREPIGKQDQYIAAYGGIQFMRFQPDGSVFVDPVICPCEAKRQLDQRLLLFHVGGTRRAREILSRQSEGTSRKMEVFRRLCEIANEMRQVLTTGRELATFGRLLHEAWLAKKSIESSISDGRIDEIYESGLTAGALGGKLLGAGGGGFILFYCEPHHHGRLREALTGCVEVPFALEPQGTKVIYVGEDQW